MNRVFTPGAFATAPDGTQVSAFLNATDSASDDARPGLIDTVSIAAGRIAPGTSSRIHTHPAVTQVTYVVTGALRVVMADSQHPDRYALEVPAGSAVLSEPGTLLQLCNPTTAVAEVLYIVSPSYVRETSDDGAVVYEDAVLVAEDWSEVEPGAVDVSANASASHAAALRRAAAVRRLALRRDGGG